MMARKAPEDRIEKVWSHIALHCWDINFFRGATSRAAQFGITYDVVGFPDVELDPADTAELLRRYPRLDFTCAFHRLLEDDFDNKAPYPHAFHPCTRIAHNRSPLQVVELSVLQESAPFDE